MDSRDLSLFLKSIHLKCGHNVIKTQGSTGNEREEKYFISNRKPSPKLNPEVT